MDFKQTQRRIHNPMKHQTSKRKPFAKTINSLSHLLFFAENPPQTFNWTPNRPLKLQNVKKQIKQT